jgi:hypothetical protein
MNRRAERAQTAAPSQGQKPADPQGPHESGKSGTN